MTIELFLKEIQGLYGAYNEFQKKHVVACLEKYNGEVLGQLLKYIISTVSWTHNYRPPGIAEFEKGIKEIAKMNSIEYKPYEPPLLDEDVVSPEQAQELFADMKDKIKGKNCRTGRLSVDEQKRRAELNRQADYLRQDPYKD